MHVMLKSATVPKLQIRLCARRAVLYVPVLGGNNRPRMAYKYLQYRSQKRSVAFRKASLHGGVVFVSRPTGAKNETFQMSRYRDFRRFLFIFLLLQHRRKIRGFVKYFNECQNGGFEV